MQKIWLDSYPEGVPDEINLDAYQSIIEVFEESVSKYPQHRRKIGHLQNTYRQYLA